jgi:hypothetical protein
MEQGEGEEAVNNPIDPVAYVFKHKRTGEVVVTSGRAADYWDKEHWEHTASINACLAIQYILSVGPKERNRYIRSLTEKI